MVGTSRQSIPLRGGILAVVTVSWYSQPALQILPHGGVMGFLKHSIWRLQLESEDANSKLIRYTRYRWYHRLYLRVAQIVVSTQGGRSQSSIFNPRLVSCQSCDTVLKESPLRISFAPTDYVAMAIFTIGLTPIAGPVIAVLAMLAGALAVSVRRKGRRPMRCPVCGSDPVSK